MPETRGKLYLCATPIGNLEDVSIRLLKTLRRVDMIACEDTRHTLKLLNRYKIRKPLQSYHRHSGRGKENWIIEQLRQGKHIALVSDAGMPGISDPGQELVQKAIAAGLDIEVLPGPSAVIAALAVSGLDTSSFVFAGFLPAQRSQRCALLTRLAEEPRTVVVYEAPHRLLKTLEDMEEVLGSDRELAIVRELTKVYEEVKRGQVGVLRQYFTANAPRGEICIVIGTRRYSTPEIDMESIAGEVEELIARGIEKKEAFKIKAREYNISKSSVYKYYLDFSK